jgi:hypothetical protein
MRYLRVTEMLPITPQQVQVSKAFPSEVFEAFNFFIQTGYRNGESIVRQCDVIRRLEELGYSKSRVEHEKLLDIEEVYRDAGWEVEYDKPGYNETWYEPKFIFRKKS